MILLALLATIAQPSPVLPGEEPVDPYVMSNANAGAKPFADTSLWTAFHEAAGVARVVDGTVDRITRDPRTADIFKSQDLVRLRRLLKEQFCYILNGGCDYTGRDMATAHKDLGLQTADVNALVEALQEAMDKEGVPFATQNRFVAKLAPMKRVSIER